MNDLKRRVIELISRNINFLSKWQVKEEGLDNDAIKDYVLNKVIGDNYATEEYSVALSYLLLEEKDLNLSNNLKLAMDFHSRTTNGYPKGEHSEHYQHRRVGFLESFLNLKKIFDERELRRWEDIILSWDIKNANNCNWHAMNALLDACVYNITKKYKFWLHSIIEFLRVWKYRRKDGMFSDSFDSLEWKHVKPAYHPMAYHSFTTALLHRYWRVTRNPIAKKFFLKGAENLLWLVPPSGHPAYRGRSAGHIFTYGVSYYVLLAAALETGIYEYMQAANCILNKLEELQDDQGRFPLIANTESYDKMLPFQEKYAYHSVYNAHCSAWLARSLPLLQRVNSKILEKRHSLKGSRFLKSSGLFIVKKDSYTAVVSDGSGGNNDCAFSLAMLDFNGELCSLIPSDVDVAVDSGHICEIIKDNKVLWRSKRKIGNMKRISEYELVGKMTIETKQGSFDWTREYEFLDDRVDILDKMRVAKNNRPFEDVKVRVSYSIPNACRSCNIETTCSLMSKDTQSVLGNGSTFYLEGGFGRQREVELHYQIVCNSGTGG